MLEKKRKRSSRRIGKKKKAKIPLRQPGSTQPIFFVVKRRRAKTLTKSSIILIRETDTILTSVPNAIQKTSVGLGNLFVGD